MLYIIDFAFSGSKNDLIKACHMNNESFNWNPKNYNGFNASDTIWWTYIFNGKFPIVKKFIETYRNFEKPVIQTYNEDLYIECISEWFYIIKNYFVIEDLQRNDFIFYPNWGGIWYIESNRFKNKSWINKLKNGDFNNNIILNKIYYKYYNKL